MPPTKRPHQKEEPSIQEPKQQQSETASPPPKRRQAQKLTRSASSAYTTAVTRETVTVTAPPPNPSEPVDTLSRVAQAFTHLAIPRPGDPDLTSQTLEQTELSEMADDEHLSTGSGREREGDIQMDNGDDMVSATESLATRDVTRRGDQRSGATESSPAPVDAVVSTPGSDSMAGEALPDAVSPAGNPGAGSADEMSLQEMAMWGGISEAEMRRQINMLNAMERRKQQESDAPPAPRAQPPAQLTRPPTARNPAPPSQAPGRPARVVQAPSSQQSLSRSTSDSLGSLEAPNEELRGVRQSLSPNDPFANRGSPAPRPAARPPTRSPSSVRSPGSNEESRSLSATELLRASRLSSPFSRRSRGIPPPTTTNVSSQQAPGNQDVSDGTRNQGSQTARLTREELLQMSQDQMASLVQSDLALRYAAARARGSQDPSALPNLTEIGLGVSSAMDSMSTTPEKDVPEANLCKSHGISRVRGSASFQQPTVSSLNKAKRKETSKGKQRVSEPRPPAEALYPPEVIMSIQERYRRLQDDVARVQPREPTAEKAASPSNLPVPQALPRGYSSWGIYDPSFVYSSSRDRWEAKVPACYFLNNPNTQPKSTLDPHFKAYPADPTEVPSLRQREVLRSQNIIPEIHLEDLDNDALWADRAANAEKQQDWARTQRVELDIYWSSSYGRGGSSAAYRDLLMSRYGGRASAAATTAEGAAAAAGASSRRGIYDGFTPEDMLLMADDMDYDDDEDDEHEFMRAIYESRYASRAAAVAAAGASAVPTPEGTKPAASDRRKRPAAASTTRAGAAPPHPYRLERIPSHRFSEIFGDDDPMSWGLPPPGEAAPLSPPEYTIPAQRARFMELMQADLAAEDADTYATIERLASILERAYERQRTTKLKEDEELQMPEEEKRVLDMVKLAEQILEQGRESGQRGGGGQLTRELEDALSASFIAQGRIDRRLGAEAPRKGGKEKEKNSKKGDGVSAVAAEPKASASSSKTTTTKPKEGNTDKKDNKKTTTSTSVSGGGAAEKSKKAAGKK